MVHLEARGDLVPATNQTSCYWRVTDADALYQEFAALGLPAVGDYLRVTVVAPTATEAEVQTAADYDKQEKKQAKN